MKHKKHLSSFTRCLCFALAIISLPFASYRIVASLADNDTSHAYRSTFADFAYENRREYRRLRRAYKLAIEECETAHQQLAEGESITCPDINDPDSFASFVEQGEDVEPLHAAAKNEAWDIPGLTDRERVQLQQYATMGRCPSRLRGTALHDHCKSMLGRSARKETIMGLLNEKAFERAQTNKYPNTLKARLEMIRQAKDRSNRRPDTVRYRPRTD